MSESESFHDPDDLNYTLDEVELVPLTDMKMAHPTAGPSGEPIPAQAAAR